MDLLKEISINDLDETQKDIAFLIGLESYKKMVERYGGSDVYIQKSSTITRHIRDKKIMDMYSKGFSIHDICSSLNLSESTVRYIIKECIEYTRYTHRNQISMI